MDQEPSSSKWVKYFDADYEETVLNWFAEINSDDSDIESVCEDNFAIESEHASESEVEGNKNNFIHTRLRIIANFLLQVMQIRRRMRQ
nr:unnamed protein product [Callosobruchus analis]